MAHQFLELEKNGKYGLASPDGRIIIPVKYDEVEIFDCYNPGDGVIDFVFRVEKMINMEFIHQKECCLFLLNMMI